MEPEILDLIHDYLLTNSCLTAAAALKKACRANKIKLISNQKMSQLSEVYSLWASRNASAHVLPPKATSGSVERKIESAASTKGKKKRTCEDENSSRPKKKQAIAATEADSVPSKNSAAQQSEALPPPQSSAKSPVKSQDRPGGAVNNMKLGQWQMAALDSEDRENKFFRLLGGAKAGKEQQLASNKKLGLFKGLSGKSGNTAMAKEQQESFFKTLENQFESARNMGLQNKGGGLGFQKDPSEGKKFHIDTGVKKSKSFDD